MTVRCKFTCTKAEAFGDGFESEFSAVTSGAVENDAFFKATPGGSLHLSVTTKQHFVVGQEYYLDITPATPAGEVTPEA